MSEQNPVDVHYIQTEDTERIYSMDNDAHKALRLEDRALSVDDLFHFTERDRSRIYVASVDGQVVGCLLFEANEQEGVIVRLLANPQRRGYGSALLRKAEELAEKCGCTTLTATVYDEDLSTQNFFKANGFRGMPVRVNERWTGSAVQFSKQVSK